MDDEDNITTIMNVDKNDGIVNERNGRNIKLITLKTRIELNCKKYKREKINKAFLNYVKILDMQAQN